MMESASALMYGSFEPWSTSWYIRATVCAVPGSPSLMRNEAAGSGLAASGSGCVLMCFRIFMGRRGECVGSDAEHAACRPGIVLEGQSARESKTMASNHLLQKRT